MMYRFLSKRKTEDKLVVKSSFLPKNACGFTTRGYRCSTEQGVAAPSFWNRFKAVRRCAGGRSHVFDTRKGVLQWWKILDNKNPRCWHQGTAAQCCQVCSLFSSSCGTKHAASPSSTWEPTREEKRPCRTKHPLKVGWEGHTEDQKSLWVILRANLRRDGGLKPPLQEGHEAPQRCHCWGGAAGPKPTEPSEPHPGLLPAGLGVWGDERPVLAPITHPGRVCFPPAAPRLKGKHQLQTPTS